MWSNKVKVEEKVIKSGKNRKGSKEAWVEVKK
jgi:hypothetical protein